MEVLQYMAIHYPTLSPMGEYKMELLKQRLSEVKNADEIQQKIAQWQKEGDEMREKEQKKSSYKK